MSTPQITAGQSFTLDDARPYTTDGQKHVHTLTLACTVTSTHERGFDYRVDAVTAEENRPLFAAKPTGGSMAWFAVPLNVERGRLHL